MLADLPKGQWLDLPKARSATKSSGDHVARLGFLARHFTNDRDGSQRLTVREGRGRRIDQDTVAGRHPSEWCPLTVVGHNEATADAALRVVA